MIALFGLPTGLSWELFVWGLSGGIASFFSPCALPMLPAYLSYYLSTETTDNITADGGIGAGLYRSGSRQTSVYRGILFGGSASAGMLSVFGALAIITGVLGDVLTRFIPMLIPLIGVILILLGGYILVDRAGWLSYTVQLPELSEQSPKQFYLFGLLFAAAALACTAPVFFGITLTALSTGGIAGAATVLTGYGSGMVGLFILLTVLVALAEDEATRHLNSLIPYVERVSAVLLIGAGVYLLVYSSQAQTFGPLLALIY